jgi:hypothetical protein
LQGAGVYWFGKEEMEAAVKVLQRYLSEHAVKIIGQTFKISFL